MRTIKLLFSLTVVFTLSTHAQAPKWAVDLGEPIKTSDFMQDGKLIFFTSGEYAWCYDVVSGTEVWSMEVPDFNEDGISYLLGEMYLTNSDNKLQSYDATTGKLLWEKEYEDIDQSDYMSFEFIENNAVFRYDEIELGVDLNNGTELYRMEIEYWGDLIDQGTFNYSVLYKQHKMLVMEDSEIASLFDIKTGNKLLSLENYDINTDLIENGLPWLYKGADHKYLLFVLDNGAAVIDVVNNKEIMRKEFDIDGDINVLLPTAHGCAVMGEEKFVHFNFETGEVSELNFSLDDLRTLYSYRADGKDILIVSLADGMAGIDLAAGKLLWQTAEDDPEFEGYVHRFLKVDGSSVILVYNRSRMISSDRGTYLYLMSINGLTGIVNYKTTALLSKTVWTNFQRSMTDIVMSATSLFMNAATGGYAADATNQAADMVNKMLGYDYIGFDYETFEHNGNIVFFSRSNKGMWVPETRDSPGEGIVVIDWKTGEVKYRHHLEIADGLNDEEIKLLAPILVDGNDAYVAGEEKLIKFDLSLGKKLWEINNTEFISELFLNDGVIHTKFGKQVYSVGLVENDVQVKETFNMDPYGFQAFDAVSGNSLWKVSLESDPVLLTPQFSMEDYYNSENGNLYFADEQNLYALKIGKNGGSYSWKFNYEQNAIGEIEYDESFAVKEKWIGSTVKTSTTSSYIGGGWSLQTTSTYGGLDIDKTAKFLEDVSDAELATTYESWGSIWGVTATRCLRVLYGADVLLVIGPEGIAMVDANNGSKKWVSKWDYDNDDVQYIPKIVGNGIVYCSDEKLTLLDLSSGSKIWEAEESDKSKFFESPHEKYFFSINDEVIKEYTLTR